MALICKKCNGIIPDIGGHTCSGGISHSYPYPPYMPPVIHPLSSQKCDICGSTAIDHTENACQMNRMFRRLNKGTDLVPTDPNTTPDSSNKSIKADKAITQA